MIIIDGNHLNLESFVRVVKHGEKIEISQEATERVIKSRLYVEKIVSDEKVVYGITTGFGKFSDVLITHDETVDLQRNLIISHSCGVGDALSEEAVRGIMLLRINALSKGYSGIRLETLNTLVDMLNKGVHPIIPEKGSLGASGDLAPLAHMVLVMIGEGEAIYKGRKMSGIEAMKKANIDIIKLQAKEGLALINGTQVMTSIGSIALFETLNILKLADISCALTIEALNGIIDAFDSKIQEVRGHNGQIKTALNLIRLLNNSKMTTRQGEFRVQDPYSIRCVPQVHGASKDAFNYVKNVLETEMNAATDNPLIFADEDEVFSGGNFHGQPVALAMDFLGIALSEIANISERRLERLVNPSLSNGLPAFLTTNGGVNSGFMIVQYAAAALVSENKILAHPASVDSIPSSGNQEDHVSMGTIAARKALEISQNVRKVLAMEILTACQAIDLRGNKGLGEGTSLAYSVIRNKIPKLEKDRIMYIDINKVEEIISENTLLKEIENNVIIEI
ncbi:histidine ammonia-lyase [Soehngenia longivitae]|uniref:Histidine ammonia-lyase n=1 Tax=Soehngenia longivitae TaxID=2562294 RepID=A0A4Z0D4L6_9FIRM|nr:histidine ammonia-lyase [Soehngenia longivitae]TFZ39173.1 histidine ammonia-lyase [Soehngenia longivitae]